MATTIELRPAGPQREHPPSGGLVAVVREALARAKRADTPEGAVALRLAETLADDGHTASGVAALAKQLLASVDAALKGAEAETDVVDELKERRARRRAG